MGNDTPDYQRSTGSTQVLLGTYPHTSTTETVTVPANTETLIVVFNGESALPPPTVQGVSSGTQYPVTQVFTTLTDPPSRTFYAEVESAIDNEVTVTWTGLFGGEWYICSDSAARSVADISKLATEEGVQYVVPAIPSVLAGDHPPSEILCAFGEFSSDGYILPQPGAGLRYRLFAFTAVSPTAGMTGCYQEPTDNNVYAWYGAPGTLDFTLPGQGIPMPENTALGVVILSGVGVLYAAVYYSVEGV